MKKIVLFALIAVSMAPVAKAKDCSLPSLAYLADVSVFEERGKIVLRHLPSTVQMSVSPWERRYQQSRAKSILWQGDTRQYALPKGLEVPDNVLGIRVTFEF
jgi:hypothetical protein